MTQEEQLAEFDRRIATAKQNMSNYEEQLKTERSPQGRVSLVRGIEIFREEARRYEEAKGYLQSGYTYESLLGWVAGEVSRPRLYEIQQQPEQPQPLSPVIPQGILVSTKEIKSSKGGTSTVSIYKTSKGYLQEVTTDGKTSWIAGKGIYGSSSAEITDLYTGSLIPSPARSAEAFPSRNSPDEHWKSRRSAG